MRPTTLPFALLLFLVAGGCAAPPPAAAPPASGDAAAVMATVQRLFDGMRAGDGAVVASVFHPGATLATVDARDGTTAVRAGSVERFVTSVGTPHDEVWDERIWNEEVRIDGDLATAWMDYAFYLDDRLSHCGVDAIQLVRTEAGWKIFHLADTRRQQGCSPPPGP